jgi:tetratricopeptide (TPR) repeat protein
VLTAALPTVEALEKTGQPMTRVYDAWLRVPEWQTAGGRGADAIESIAAIKARLDKDLPAARGADAAALTGFLAAAWGIEAMALESLRKYPEAAQGYEKAAELAKKSLGAGGDAAAQSRRIAEFSALGARVARLHLSDSARAKRSLTLALGAMPKVDRAEYTGLEATYTEYVKRLADAPGDEEVQLYSKGVHDYTVQLTEKRQDVHAAAVVLRELAYVKLSRADAAGAAVDAEQALALSSPLADQSLAHSCRIALSMARLELGDALDALALADAGIKASHLLPQWHARFHAARGRALTRLGRLDEARETLTEGVRLARESRDDEAYADTLRDLGRLELEAGNPGKAATQFRSAELEDREKGDPVRIADDLVNAGKVLRVMARYDDARDRLKEARELAKPADAWEVLVRVGLESGRVHAAQNDHEGALAAFRAGLDAEKHLSLPGVRWMLQLGEATALAELHRDADAEKALLEAASAVELLPARPRRAPGAVHIDFEFKDVYDQLVKLYAAQNRAADAFDAAERWRSRGFVDMTARSAGVFKRGREAVERYTERLSKLREAEAEAGEAAPDERARARAGRRRRPRRRGRRAPRPGRRGRAVPRLLRRGHRAVGGAAEAHPGADHPADLLHRAVGSLGVRRGRPGPVPARAGHGRRCADDGDPQLSSAYGGLRRARGRLEAALRRAPGPRAGQAGAARAGGARGAAERAALRGPVDGQGLGGRALELRVSAVGQPPAHARRSRPPEPSGADGLQLGRHGPGHRAQGRHQAVLPPPRGVARPRRPQWPAPALHPRRRPPPSSESFPLGHRVYAGPGRHPRGLPRAKAGKARICSRSPPTPVYVPDNPMLSYLQFGGIAARVQLFPAFGEPARHPLRRPRARAERRRGHALGVRDRPRRSRGRRRPRRHASGVPDRRREECRVEPLACVRSDLGRADEELPPQPEGARPGHGPARRPAQGDEVFPPPGLLGGLPARWPRAVNPGRAESLARVLLGGTRVDRVSRRDPP